MARLNTFIYCESVGFIPMPDGTSKTIVNQPLMRINVRFIPTLYSFSVVLGLTDITNDASFQVVFKERATGEIVSDTGYVPMPPPPQDQNMAGEGFMNVNIMNVVINNTGEYIAEVFVDRELAGVYPIEVRRIG